MIYTGTFKSIQISPYYEQREYEVKFTTAGPAGSADIMLDGITPVIINVNGDELFEEIKTQSATVNIITKNYLFDLYNSNYEVTCVIKDITDENDQKVVFMGFVTPNIYSQDYNNYSRISVECISGLAMLKYKDYTITGAEKGYVSFLTLFKKCLFDSFGYDLLYIWAENKYGYNIDGGTASTVDDILGNLYIDENNFFDDDEKQTPWKLHEVLTELLRFLNLTLYEFGGVNGLTLYAMNISYNFTNTSSFGMIYNLQTPAFLDTQGPESRSVYAITANDYANSSNSISLDKTYNKIVVKANTYPYEEIFANIFDSDKWILADGYNADLNSLSNSYNVPTVAWGNNENYYYLYWLYYQSSLMTPYMYTVDINNNDRITSQGQGYINSWLYNTWQLLQNYKKTVGIELMKQASYNAQNKKLTSSLSWNSDLVLCTGVNNFVANGTPGTETAALKTRVGNYITNFTKIYGGLNNYMPPYPLLKVESTSALNITNDSYIILSGKVMVNDENIENSRLKDWSGTSNWEKTAFTSPTGYELKDLLYNQERAYVGFPMMNIQIRIKGNTRADDLILCQMKGLNAQTFRQEMQYSWKKPADIGYDPDTSPELLSWQPWVTIMVGEDTFSFYKFYEITNTCDWRLGLESGNGFALPALKSDNINGVMEIYFLNADKEIYTRFVEDIRNLPTTSVEYVIERNPGNMFSSPMWNDDVITYTPIYTGQYPNYLLIQNFKVDVKKVSYTTLSDTVKSNDENKDTDHIYENIINLNNVEEFSDLECKINTQDLKKNKSFSSVMALVDGKYQYVTKMTNDGGLNYKTQENNIVDKYWNHYKDPKVRFKCNLKACNYSLNDFFYKNTLLSSNNLIMNNASKDLYNNTLQMELIEV